MFRCHRRTLISRSVLLIYCFLCSLHRWSRDSCCHAPCFRGYALLHSDYSLPSLPVPKAGPVLLPAGQLSLSSRLLHRPVNRLLVTSRIRHCKLAPTTCPRCCQVIKYSSYQVVKNLSVSLLRYARALLLSGFLAPVQRYSISLLCHSQPDGFTLSPLRHFCDRLPRSAHSTVGYVSHQLVVSGR